MSVLEIVFVGQCEVFVLILRKVVKVKKTGALEIRETRFLH